MNILKTGFAAVFTACLSFAHAGTPITSGAAYQFSSVECTTAGDNIHISCKLSDIATGDKAELPGFLINYDVLDKSGKIIASGYGSTAMVDESKLTPGAEYSINVFALINGEVISQSILRRAPAQK